MKMALFLAEGFEEIEAVAIVDVLRRGGVEVDMISVTASKQVAGAHQIVVLADCLFADANFSTYEMLLLPGGMPGTKNLKTHTALCKLLIEFHLKEKFLGAICAAPSILGELGILNGKQATCYPGFEKYLIGCTYVDQAVVRSDYILTGKGAGVAIQFGLEILRIFHDDEFVNELSVRMIKD